MYKDRNGAFERSQSYHARRVNPDFGGHHANIILDEYHYAIFSWQNKYKRIMPKKLREKYYKRIVLDRTT